MSEESFYQVSPPEWQPGQDLQPGPDGQIKLFDDLEEAVELAGEIGGLVLELRLAPEAVTRDWSGRPHATPPIPARRILVLGS